MSLALKTKEVQINKNEEVLKRCRSYGKSIVLSLVLLRL